MKKSILILISMFLSALIIYGGSGVNAYFYCCNDCRAEGFAAVIEHKCCEIHHHHHLNGLITHYDAHTCDQSILGHSGECGIERISADLNSPSYNTPNLQPIIINLNFNHLFTISNSENYAFDEDKSKSYFASQKPPNQSKSEYFSLLTTLLI